MIENEKKILDAACKVFIAKGFDGTRMQEIADEAGINKSLLHYYYRSKDKLFEVVFIDAFKGLFPIIEKVFTKEGTLFERIEQFVKAYITIIQNNPYIPIFVLHELNNNAEKLPLLFNAITKAKENNLLGKLSMLIEIEVQKGTIRPIKAEQLFANIVSLSIFPFVSKPILKGVLFDNDENMFNQFIENRKTEVAEFVINSIKI
jgi:AcrR family transcriptional regulator